MSLLPLPSMSAMDCSSDESVQDQEVFVWPWMGILANVPGEQAQGGGAILMKQLADFKPVQFTAVDGGNGYIGYVILGFTKDCTGFKNALACHSYFESQRLGKLDWKATKQHVKHVFGWLAKEEDYKSDDPVGRFLSANGSLKTVYELEQEMSSKTYNLIVNLTKQITTKSKYLEELECRCNQVNLSLQGVMEESDLLHKRYNEEMRIMQKERPRELNELDAQTDMERTKLRKKNADQNDSLNMARIQQQKADERKLQLLEKHKKEEVALNITLQLERLVDEKQKLELDIEQLKGKLEVVKYMEGEGVDVKKRFEELTAELNERIEEMEALNQILVVKERMTNDEIQAAKRELITVI